MTPTDKATTIITEAIVTKGLNYDDAIKWCESQAKLVSAPYLEAAARLASELDRINKFELPNSVKEKRL